MICIPGNEMVASLDNLNSYSVGLAPIPLVFCTSELIGSVVRKKGYCRYKSLWPFIVRQCVLSS